MIFLLIKRQIYLHLFSFFKTVNGKWYLSKTFLHVQHQNSALSLDTISRIDKNPSYSRSAPWATPSPSTRRPWLRRSTWRQPSSSCSRTQRPPGRRSRTCRRGRVESFFCIYIKYFFVGICYFGFIWTLNALRFGKRNRWFVYEPFLCWFARISNLIQFGNLQNPPCQFSFKNSLHSWLWEFEPL